MTVKRWLRLGLHGLAVLALLPSVQADEEPVPAAPAAPKLAEVPWIPAVTAAPGTEAETPLPTLVSARYEVDVYGGMAGGRLVQRFETDPGLELRAVYGLVASPAMTVDGLTVEIDGSAFELDSKPFPELQIQRGEAGGTPRSRARPGRQAARTTQTESRVYRSVEFDVAGVEGFEIRSRFVTAMPLERGRFRLRLPQVVRAGEAGAVEVPVGVVVNVHQDAPLRFARSSTHEVIVDYEGDRTAIELVEQDRPLGRPFEVELALRPEDEPNLAGYVGEESDGRRAVTALFQAPVEIADDTVRPKQVLFVLDTSGSMLGQEKLPQARRAIRACLARLGPQDTFNIVEFDSSYEVFSPAPVASSQETLERASRWIEALKADGGTQLLGPLEATLIQPQDDERHRLVVLVTDGVIQDEEETLALLKRELGQARLFVVGIGPAMRQQTILRLVEFGRGGAAFADDERELEGAVTEMFDAIAQPLAWDLAFDWGGADVEEVQPSRFPDLYAGRPVKVHAWMRGELPEELRVRVTTTAGQRDYSVRLPPSSAD
jgi:hypothetical protein